MAFVLKNTRKHADDFINCIVYGESGVGKTSLLRDLPAKEILILSAEKGLLSLKKEEPEHGYDYVEVKYISEIMEVLNDDEFCKKYKYFVIDSITELSQNEVVRISEVYSKLEKEAKKNQGAFALKMWGEFGSNFATLFKKLRDNNDSVIAIALLAEVESASGAIVRKPDIAGKTKDRILAWFDEVFYMGASKEGRKFITNKNETTAAKDRSGKLDAVEVANIAKVFEKIRA